MILPTNPNKGILLFNLDNPKYFFYNYSLAFKWSFPVASMINYNLSFMLSPLGKEKAWGFCCKIGLKGDFSNNSYL